MQESLLEYISKAKRTARQAVNRAVAKGHLTKPRTCAACGKPGRIEGHHQDYAKPLDIIWLCRRCHVAQHPTQTPPRRRRILTNHVCTCLRCGYVWSPFRWNPRPKYCAGCHKEGWRKPPVLSPES